MEKNIRRLSQTQTTSRFYRVDILAPIDLSIVYTFHRNARTIDLAHLQLPRETDEACWNPQVSRFGVSELPVEPHRSTALR